MSGVRGMGLLETVVSVGVFSLLSLVITATLLQSFAVWRRSSSQQTSEQTLYKAQNMLARDLTVTAPDKVAAQVSLSSLGSPDGDAVWFLSFINPVTSQPVYHDGTGLGELGEPRWQRNVLYYSVVPANHDSYAGQACVGGAGPDGYEDHCPHKMLIRKIINGPNDADGNEKLLPSVTAYLNKPSGIDVSAMGGPGVEETKIVGRDILHFQVTNAKPEVTIDLRATAILEARKTLHVGVDALSSSPNTMQRLFSVFPKNASQETL